MEYLRDNKDRVIVEGNTIQYNGGAKKEQIIGSNYAGGFRFGGYLSSFDRLFTDEKIGIQSWLADVVNAKIGDISDAIDLLNQKLNSRKMSDINDLACTVIETVNEYFGGFQNTSSRMDYYYEEGEEESKNNIVSNLKGTGAAMCVERSALTQNLLCYLGIKSIYKSSTILKNGNQEVHSYNLIEYKNHYYIFDTSIPNYIDGRINPLIAEIDKETFDLISCPLSEIGISITVSHYNPYRDINVKITYDSKRKRSVEFPSLSENSKFVR